MNCWGIAILLPDMSYVDVQACVRRLDQGPPEVSFSINYPVLLWFYG